MVGLLDVAEASEEQVLKRVGRTEENGTETRGTTKQACMHAGKQTKLIQGERSKNVSKHACKHANK